MARQVARQKKMSNYERALQEQTGGNDKDFVKHLYQACAKGDQNAMRHMGITILKEMRIEAMVMAYIACEFIINKKAPDDGYAVYHSNRQKGGEYFCYFELNPVLFTALYVETCKYDLFGYRKWLHEHVNYVVNCLKKRAKNVSAEIMYHCWYMLGQYFFDKKVRSIKTLVAATLKPIAVYHRVNEYLKKAVYTWLLASKCVFYRDLQLKIAKLVFSTREEDAYLWWSIKEESKLKRRKKQIK